MSLTFPPHLPPPSCNLARHRQWQRLKILLAAGVLGLVAGFSGASIMLGWIWPGFAEGDVWFTTYNRPVGRGQLEARVREEMGTRIMSVYKETSAKEEVGYLSESNKIGEGVIVSSDGWLAVYFPSFNGDSKKITVLGSDDSVYSPEKGTLDARTGIAFFKLKGDGFRVVSFGDEPNIGDEFFVYQSGSWRRLIYSGRRFGAYGFNHLESSPVLAYAVEGQMEASLPVINSQGRLVGLTMRGNLVFPSSYLSNLLPGVFSRGAARYLTLGVDGWFNEEQPIIVQGERVAGFYVSRLLPNVRSSLQKGNIILTLNGRDIEDKIVKPGDLWYNGVGEKVKLTVWRRGKVAEVEGVVGEGR